VERSLANFIRALRMADVRVSTAETLDAFRTAEVVGWRDRTLLKDALALVLPKTHDEKEAYDACFEQFFRVEDFRTHADAAADPDGAAQDDGSATNDADGDAQGDASDAGGGGESAGQGGERRGPPAGGSPGAPGSGQDGDERSELEALVHPGELADAGSALGRMLMEGDRSALAMEIARAAREAGVEEIRVFTQKGLYTRRIMDGMGLGDLQEEISRLHRSAELPDRRLALELERRRDGLREQIRDYVERQFLLHADATGARLREELLRTVKLSNVEQRNMRHLRSIVQKMAKRLVAAHARRRRITRRGQLHVPRTIRQNLRHDGNLIDLSWKSKKIERPKVFAICDVSGSVSYYARFMLMFLYSLEEVLPKVRAFAFSSDLAEVTDLFQREDIDEAIAHTLHDYAGGSTDYGQAFSDFLRLAGDDLDHRSTVIILGDARNNYGEARTELLRRIYDRSRRVLWLNPEPELAWGGGDSEMNRYRAHVHQVAVCNSLQHLERVVSDLLRSAN
jgi:uncharacterized protein with von Willebrand factor type A (vWA) domain